MTDIFGILESEATQCVAPTQEFFFLHRLIYSLWVGGGEIAKQVLMLDSK